MEETYGPPLDAATGIGPNPETKAPKPDRERPEPELRDLRIRLIGIPFFGVAIPNLTGLFAPVVPYSADYWAGYVWFVALSYGIWHGNRYFLIEQRRHYDWFHHPWRKVTLLLFANVFWTAPLTVAMLVAWYRYAAAAPDVDAIRVVTLANVICVVFITHVYETVYLIQQREGDRLAVAELQQQRAEAELASLKAQIDPHFLFNSLNALAHLIPREPARALAFTEGLADTYRYILTHRQRDLVPLADEVAFLEAYAGLICLRFGDALRIDLGGLAAGAGFLVPPISLQLLVENAVKHNALDAREPLPLRLALQGDAVLAVNPLRPKRSARPSSRLGLRNLDARCRRVLGRGLEIAESEGRFAVTVPLLRTAA